MAWDGDSKNAVNTHFGKVGDIRRSFEYMGALIIDDVFRSVILDTLKSSNNRALRTAYDQILDDLDDDKDLTFAHIQTVFARQFRHTKERHPDPPSDNGDPLRDYLLPLAVIHGLVTVSTPGPVQNTYSTELLQVQLLGQNYKNRNYSKVRNYVLYIHFLLLPTKQ
jgi:hypothetical protein